MNRILTVAIREFAEMVKTKTFILSLLCTPLLIGGMAWMSSHAEKSARNAPNQPRRLTVADGGSGLSTEIANAVRRHNESSPNRTIALEILPSEEKTTASLASEISSRIRAKESDIGLLLAEGIVERNEPVRYYSRSDSFNEFESFSIVRGIVDETLVRVRCDRQNVSHEMLDSIRRPAWIDRIDVTVGTKQKESKMILSMMAPFFFVFMMFMGMVGINQHMLTSVIEEKNSRVIEILLSAVSPFQLMAGKIFGLSAVGLSVVSIWCAAAIGAAVHLGLRDIVNPTALGFFAVYFILSFFLFGAIYAAIGAACNTLKEAQPLIMPVTFALVIPMMLWMYFVQNPSAPWTVILSIVPPFSPLVMMIRLASQPNIPIYQIAASLVLLAAASLGAIWTAGRIFRIGILLYGKPPTPIEMLRWIRQS